MRPLGQINRVEDPNKILETLKASWLPRTAYYGIVIQNAVSKTVLDQHLVVETMCSACTQHCCLNANHLHIADVLRFYYSGLEYMIPFFLPLPKGFQCQMLGETGCVLPRIRRPLICISYFCERAAEKYTDLFVLGKHLRASMEALTKLYLAELGKIGKKDIPRQEETLKQFEQKLAEYIHERTVNTDFK